MPVIVDTTYQLFGLVVVSLLTMMIVGLMVTFVFAYTMRILLDIAQRIRLSG